MPTGKLFLYFPNVYVYMLECDRQMTGLVCTLDIAYLGSIFVQYVIDVTHRHRFTTNHT